MAEWHPDIEVDDADVDEALRRAGIVAGPARVLARGWDNVAWLAPTRGSGDLLVRIPVRGIGVPGALRERELLPALAALDLPLALPSPITVLDAGDRLRWGGIAYPVVPGIECVLVDPRLLDTVTIGRSLGRFLARLHDPATLESMSPAVDLPLDPMRRADTAYRVDATRTAAAELLVGELDAPEAAILEDLLVEAAGHPLDPDAGPIVLAHGDLHARHLLLAPDGSDALGVIDFGDACRAPRAVDLPLLWMLLDGAGRDAFRSAYGDLREDELRHARVLAAMLAVMLFASADDVGIPGMRDACRRMLARVLRPT